MVVTKVEVYTTYQRTELCMGGNNFLPPFTSIVFVDQFPLDPDSAMCKEMTENWHVLHTGNTAIHVYRSQIAARWHFKHRSNTCCTLRCPPNLWTKRDHWGTQRYWTQLSNSGQDFFFTSVSSQSHPLTLKRKTCILKNSSRMFEVLVYSERMGTLWQMKNERGKGYSLHLTNSSLI